MQDQECGTTWHGLSAVGTAIRLPWKPQRSLLEGLDEFSETWPRWGMMRNGACWDATTLVDLTSAKGSGSRLLQQKSDAKRCRFKDRIRIPGRTESAEHESTG